MTTGNIFLGDTNSILLNMTSKADLVLTSLHCDLDIFDFSGVSDTLYHILGNNGSLIIHFGDDCHGVERDLRFIDVVRELRDVGFFLSQEWVWVKTGLNTWDKILQFNKDYTYTLNIENNSNVITMRTSPHHVSMTSPVAKFFIRTLSNVSDMIVDPFDRTGATTYASQDLHRNSVAITNQLHIFSEVKGKLHERSN